MRSSSSSESPILPLLALAQYPRKARVICSATMIWPKCFQCREEYESIGGGFLQVGRDGKHKVARDDGCDLQTPPWRPSSEYLLSNPFQFPHTLKYEGRG